MNRAHQYRGRFAPTPSGPLHLGSLLTALASYLQARQQGGLWLLRFDDLDRPRCPQGMDREILRQLHAHALHWDEDACYQTACLPRYRDALERLDANGQLYACRCTRADLARTALPGPDGTVYAGTCHGGQADSRHGRFSLRLQAPAGVLCFDDGIHGRVCRTLASEVGDFVVRRSDRQISYQLACAVDEARLGITEVVRGADLLGSTFQQLCVMQALGLTPPRYRHLPLLVGDRGEKLSKQNHAEPLQDRDAVANLRHCLEWLGQESPPHRAGATPAGLIAWAEQRWRAERIPRTAQIRVA